MITTATVSTDVPPIDVDVSALSYAGVIIWGFGIATGFPMAVSAISDIVSKIPGCRPLDAGELSNAMAIEAFTAVLLQLNVRYKTRVAPKLTGIKRDPRAPKPVASDS